MTRFRKATKGEPIRRHITAQAWNAVVDQLNDPHGQPIGGGFPFRGNNATHVLVKGDADYDRFGVVGLASPLILPTANLAEFQARVAFTGATPAAAHRFQFGVLQEPLKAGQIGAAIVAGVTPCKLYVANQYQTLADVKAGDKTQLLAGFFGAAQILGREPITTYPASVWGIVRLGEPITPPVEGKTDASHGKGANGVVSIWVNSGGGDVDTGENITAFNRYATLASGKWVAAQWCNNVWRLIAAEC